MSASNYFVHNPSNHLIDSSTSQILNKSDSITFHKSLIEYKPSSVIQLQDLAQKLAVKNIFIKDESSRFGLKAFKGLGTSYAVKQILQRNYEIETFCTATDGNHGKALAWSARLAGKKAVIIVPIHTTKARIKSIEAENAKVIRFEGNYDDACIYADELSKQDGWELIQDVAWDGYEEIPAQIMAGYLSIFKEMEASLNSLPKPQIDVIFLQAGVGSFAASAVWYYLNRYGQSKPKIVIVEPFEADGILESFKQSQLSNSFGIQETIMAGLNCGLPSSIAWPILQSGVDAVIRIKDDFAKSAMKLLFHAKGDDQSIVAGESGAAGLAGFLAMQKDADSVRIFKHLNINKNSSILFFNTEGDTDPTAFETIISSS